MLGSLCLSAGVPVHQQHLCAGYLCVGHLGAVSHPLPTLPSPRCHETIQRDEMKHRAPGWNTEPPLQKGLHGCCLLCSALARGHWEHQHSSFPCFETPGDVPEVTKVLGTAALLRGRKTCFPGVSTGHGLQLAMVTPSFRSGMQCFPLLCTFLAGFLIF